MENKCPRSGSGLPQQGARAASSSSRSKNKTKGEGGGRRGIKKTLPIGAALDVVKDTAKANFDETVEMAMVLNVDPRKSNQIVRGAVQLPKGTGKKVGVAVCVWGGGGGFKMYTSRDDDDNADDDDNFDLLFEEG